MDAVWRVYWCCSLANEFLKNLSTENSGRYLCVSQRHASDGAFDAHLFAHQLVENNFADPEVLRVVMYTRGWILRYILWFLWHFVESKNYYWLPGEWPCSVSPADVIMAAFQADLRKSVPLRSVLVADGNNSGNSSKLLQCFRNAQLLCSAVNWL